MAFFNRLIVKMKEMYLKVSIQWSLFFVLSILMLVVTLVLGFNLYHVYSIAAKEGEVKKLRIIARDWYKFTNVQLDQLSRTLKREEVLVERRLKDTVMFLNATIENGGLKSNLYNDLYGLIDNKSLDLLIVDSSGKIIMTNDPQIKGKNLKKLKDSKGIFVFFDHWDSFMNLDSKNTYSLHVEWPIEMGLKRKSIMVFTFEPKHKLLIGLRLFYEDFKSFELNRLVKNELRDMIAQERIGTIGYIWVLNSKGDYIVSKDRLRDRENVYDEKDYDGKYPVREIISKALELKGSETAVHFYKWKNIGEEPRRKIAAFSYMPEWDWIIGASSYEDDYLSKLKIFKERMLLVGFLSVLVSLMIAFFLSMVIARPIKRLELCARMISEGELDFKVAIGESFLNKEIFGLFNSFKSMAGSIKSQIETIQESKAHFEELNEELMASKEFLEDNNQYLMAEIEQRLSTEYKLIEQRELLTSIVSTVPQYIFWKDTNYRYLGCNEKYAKLFGFSDKEDLIGKTDNELFGDGDYFLQASETEVDVLENGQIFFNREKVINTNKNNVEVLYDVIPLKDSEDKIIGILGVYTDIGALKETERDREKLLRDLQHAQKLESIGTLAAGIAHEINTPIQYIKDNHQFVGDEIKCLLNIVCLYRELKKTCVEQGSLKNNETLMKLEQSEKDIDLEYLIEELPKAIDESKEGLDRVAKIVRAMKSYSHIDNENKSSADVNKAIDNTITISRNEWKYVADVKTDFDDTNPVVDCYIHDIQQSVMNLIINASHAIEDMLKEREEYKGLITVTTKRLGDWFCIEVEDNGMGIPDDVKGRIFDPFFTTKDVGKGTGQGLSVVYSAVERHNGKLELETKVGQGTKFTIKIPT